MGTSKRIMYTGFTILLLFGTVYTQAECPGTRENKILPEFIQESKQKQEVLAEKIVANVSAYTGSDEENGGYGGINCEGNPLEEGMVASDDIPQGTKVIIHGKEYIVADTFGGGYRNRIDIYMPNRANALRFGRQYIEVTIIRE